MENGPFRVKKRGSPAISSQGTAYFFFGAVGAADADADGAVEAAGGVAVGSAAAALVVGVADAAAVGGNCVLAAVGTWPSGGITTDGNTWLS